MEGGVRNRTPATDCTENTQQPPSWWERVSCLVLGAVLGQACWTEGCRRAPSFSPCPSSPHILPPCLLLWPRSDRTRQTGKDALTAKKCSEFKRNPKANLTSPGVWSLALKCPSWSDYARAEPEMRPGAGLAGAGQTGSQGTHLHTHS